jgi:glycosyltransferase involved in cell wall biosynthesis
LPKKRQLAPEQPPPVRVLALSHACGTALADIRLEIPLRAWASEHQADFRMQPLRGTRLHHIEWADVIILQRSADAPSMKVARLAKACDRCLVFEIDDWLTEVPRFLRGAETFAAQRANLLVLLAAADWVTAPTLRLCRHFDAVGARAVQVPNYAWPQPIHPTIHDDYGPVTLVIASSDTVRVDFLVEPLHELQHRHGDRVRLLLIGVVQAGFANSGLRFQALPNMNRGQFLDVLCHLSNSIGLIPLDDSAFSACKSPIKYFDYTFAGLPSICSAVPTYSDVVRHHETGWLTENTVHGWLSSIEALLASATLRNVVVHAAMQEVMAHHNLEVTVKAWDAVLNALNRPQRLARPKWALADRCADLWLALSEPLKRWNKMRRDRFRQQRARID